MPNPGRSACEIRELPETLPQQEGSSRIRRSTAARAAPRSATNDEGPTDDDRPAGHPDEPIAAVRHAHGRRVADAAPQARWQDRCGRSDAAADPRPALSELRPPRGRSAPNYVCAGCFGPLEIAYDLEVAAQTLDRASARGARAPGIWRYLELLPVTAPPIARPAGRLDAARAPPSGWARPSASSACGSRTTPATRPSPSRIGPSPWPRPRRPTFGLEALACASTGNLAGATAAAAAALGLPAYVFIPADLEPAKVAHALAYGATVVPVDGTYDDVNRLCLEVADELGWGFVNVNLRPFYAEGSKTLAFEVAEQLGWRLPDVVVSPIASGALFTKLAKGFDELAAVGLIERTPVRFVGGQAAGCAPVARAFATGTDDIEPVRVPDTIVRSLAIGSPADGRYAVELARASGGSVEAIPDSATAQALRQRGRARGAPSRDGRRRDHRGRRGGPRAGRRSGRATRSSCS